MPPFFSPGFLGGLTPGPKATKVMLALPSAAGLAPGLPTLDDEDRGKLREKLLDKKNLRRLRRKSPRYPDPPTLTFMKESPVSDLHEEAITAGYPAHCGYQQAHNAAGFNVKSRPNIPSPSASSTTQLPVTSPSPIHLSVPPVVFISRPATPAGQSSGLENDINAVMKAMEAFKTKQLKYHKKDGTEVPLSETIDSVLNRIRQYSNIAGIMIQSDPTVAALAWGGFSLLLQIVGSDAELIAKVAESMADIIEYSNIYQPYQDAYKHHGTGVGKTAHDLVMLLHEDIREFCAQAKKYYERHAMARIARAAVSPFSIEFGDILDKLERHRKLLDDAVEAAKFQDDERMKLLLWLSQVPYADLHENERSRRSANTCDWLLRKERFIQWRDSPRSSLLWLHGSPGCGKSVLMSKVIEELSKEHEGDTTRVPVAYFYCNFDDEKTRQPANILATLLKQIVATRPSIPELVTEAFKRHQRSGMPSGRHSFEYVKAALKNALESTEINTAFLLVDGVDECPSNPKGQGRSLDSRSDLVRALIGLVTAQLGHGRIKVLISSRRASDIDSSLKSFPTIAVEGSDTQSDITTYVSSQLASSINQGGLLKYAIDEDPTLQQLIIDTLTQKAQGMFLWAHLQLADICQGSSVSAVKEALKELPDSYEEVYLRILKKLEAQAPRNRQLAKRVIAWILCAVRPLSVAELTEALMVRIPERRLDIEAKCPPEAILEVCMNLVVAERQGGTTIFRFAHFSVQEFLRELRTTSLEDFSKSALIIDTDRTHIEIANVCVTYLSFDPFARGPWAYETLYECRDSFETFVKEHPLLDYAAVSWTEHLRSPQEDEELSNSVSSLFSLSVNISLAFQVYWFRALVDGFPQRTAPLHIASFYGLSGPLETLLASAKPETINATDSLGRSPLHWACLKGHAVAVQRLLDAGAEMKALDSKGFNPMGLAALSGHTEIVTSLIERQRDVIQTEKEQLGTALLGAVQGQSCNSVSHLLDAGADPNLPVRDDMDALWLAAWQGDQMIVKQLLDAGADVDSGRSYGNALQEAASFGSVEVVEQLLIAGADPNASGGGAGTALNAAAFRGHYDVVELLLNAEAEIQLKGDPFGGALTLAKAMAHSDVVKLILQYAPDSSVPEESTPKTIPAPKETSLPTSPPTLASSPTNLIEMQALETAARSLFQTVETGDVDAVRLMMKFGATILNTAVANEDVPFVERFYELIVGQVDAIQKVKSTELMGLLFELFQDLYTRLQSSANRGRLLEGFRSSMGLAMQKLLDGDYATMIRGLVIHREKVLLEAIHSGQTDVAEWSLRFTAEWILVGLRTRGHSLIVRGFVKVSLLGLKALEEIGLGTTLLDWLLSDVQVNSAGSKKGILDGKKQGFVVLYELGVAARVHGNITAERQIRKTIEGLLRGSRGTEAPEIAEGIKQRLEQFLLSSNASGESLNWMDDEVPWWDEYRN
ncbi:hypothetical protein FN846DRAFT_921746 [Sphaerosporella brunnea]|uniref:NACHT domain-containing protein n=1 Tax=Sphaerosporella brunnea TaxID=1250544 RepID=A0A5J5EM69_9PEZI|nr:hypothetical protein FN846DRAFT_921746 [Sphaerosporella brunnea]